MSSLTDSPWILDSGASSHMTNDCTKFISGMKRFADLRPVYIVNGSTMEALRAGTVQLGELTLQNVWYVPNLQVNLLSVDAFNSHDLNVNFKRNGKA